MSQYTGPADCRSNCAGLDVETRHMLSQCVLLGQSCFGGESPGCGPPADHHTGYARLHLTKAVRTSLPVQQFLFQKTKLVSYVVIDFMEQQSVSQQTELLCNDTEQNLCSWKNRLHDGKFDRSSMFHLGLQDYFKLYNCTSPVYQCRYKVCICRH